MNKRLIVNLCAVLTALFSLSIFASSCPFVTSDSTPGFCQNFEQASECQCAVFGGDQCSDMESIYKNIVAFWGPDPEQAINAACKVGEINGWATMQNCLDQWHCYLHGGTDSCGAQCYGNSGPGSNCKALNSFDAQSRLCKK